MILFTTCCIRYISLKSAKLFCPVCGITLKKHHEYIDSVRRYELIVNISNISSKTTLKLSHIDCPLVAKLLCNIWFRKIPSYTPDSLKINNSCNTNNFGIYILAKVIRLTDEISKNCLIPISCSRILKVVSILIGIQSIYFKILLRDFSINFNRKIIILVTAVTVNDCRSLTLSTFFDSIALSCFYIYFFFLFFCYPHAVFYVVMFFVTYFLLWDYFLALYERRIYM
jgi:hypothetical protein